jgi:hypothetical protein
MKSGEDFRKSAIENKIGFWNFHNCSMCNYECCFIFNFGNYEVVYDSGCFCTKRRTVNISTWDSVALQYNCNLKNKETIKRYNEFWKFKD